MRQLVSLLAAAMALVAAPATASVYLNGVNIDGVTGQRFDGCTVVIDDKGNVRIEAKGYAVKIDGADAATPLSPPPGGSLVTGPASGPPAASPAAPAPGRLSRRYFLVADQAVEGGAQYEIDVFVNAQWIRKIHGTDNAMPVEVTKYFRPGPNRVFLAAKKAIIGDRRYYTRDVFIRVVIGEGNVGGDHVMIDTPLVTMTRTAADMDDRNEEFVVEAR